jgi:hypothetical protein
MGNTEFVGQSLSSSTLLIAPLRPRRQSYNGWKGGAGASSGGANFYNSTFDYRVTLLDYNNFLQVLLFSMVSYMNFYILFSKSIFKRWDTEMYGFLRTQKLSDMMMSD